MSLLIQQFSRHVGFISRHTILRNKAQDCLYLKPKKLQGAYKIYADWHTQSSITWRWARPDMESRALHIPFSQQFCIWTFSKEEQGSRGRHPYCLPHLSNPKHTDNSFPVCPTPRLPVGVCSLKVRALILGMVFTVRWVQCYEFGEHSITFQLCDSRLTNLWPSSSSPTKTLILILLGY